MTYDERIRAIAEEMATERYPTQKKRYKDNKKHPTMWLGVYVNSFMPAARIAIAHMARTFEWGFANGLEDDIQEPKRTKLLNGWLRAYGLISTENAAGSDTGEK